MLEIFSIVRMFSVAGRDGLLPTISAYLHIKRLTPVIPCVVEGTLSKIKFFYSYKQLIFFHLLGICYVLVGNADRLLGYLSFSTWLVCLCGAISVLIFRRTMPDIPRPFNAGLIAPIVFIIAMSFLTLINIIFNPYDILVGILILISGLPVYWLFVLNRTTTLDEFSRSITVYLQKIFLVIPDNNKQHD
jgi:L-type amino acid transporter 11